jgi:hypothetical protein
VAQVVECFKNEALSSNSSTAKKRKKEKKEKKYVVSLIPKKCEVTK